MNQETLKADSKLRKRVLMITGMLILFGIVVTALLIPIISSTMKSQNVTEATKIIKWMLGFFALPLVWISIYMLHLAVKAWTQGIYPPLGTKVIKDTLVVRGNKARQRAILIVSLAVILLFCISYSAYLVDNLLTMLVK